GSRNRPDIVVIDKVGRTAVIVDVTIPFENGRDAFDAARQRKIEHYAPEAVLLSQQGFRVTTEALILGALGAWDPQNDSVLRLLGVGRRYAGLLRKLAIADILQVSVEIYFSHTGPDHQEDAVDQVLPRSEPQPITEEEEGDRELTPTEGRQPVFVNPDSPTDSPTASS
ncbi:unnamed protein product, partial [Soboliphyme baturini]|uniref:RNA-binding protein n=1 Tax=Soboliphyme baturini TaxID=241478 RepID=A0A183J9U2_9BILA